MTVAGRRFGMPDSVLNIDGDSAASTSYSSSRRNMSAEGVWELVEAGFVDQAGSDEDADKLKGIKKNDAKALFLIQQAVHDTIFARIAAATTS
ncbi:hypothetical protein BC332_14572 [Capsicum chinense]|nr:hypothetical protein BC332_14572 [Capsicum chinense]